MAVTGRGWGKTFIASHKAIGLVSQKKNILIAAPTYKQLRNTLIKGMLAEFRKYGIQYKYNKTENYIKTNFNEIYGYSDEAFESARGLMG